MAKMNPDDKIGAMWLTVKHGRVHAKGTINGEKVLMFLNKDKLSERSPDYTIYRDTPKRDEAPF